MQLLTNLGEFEEVLRRIDLVPLFLPHRTQKSEVLKNFMTNATKLSKRKVEER